MEVAQGSVVLPEITSDEPADLVSAYIAQASITAKGDLDATLYRWLCEAEAGEAQAVLLAVRGSRLMRAYWQAFQRSAIRERQAAEERKRSPSRPV